MAFSTLYYTILNKPFFIDVRRIDANAVLIDKFLEHDITGMSGKKFSDSQPLPRMTTTMQAEGNQFAKAPKDSVAVIPLRGDMLKEGAVRLMPSPPCWRSSATASRRASP